MKPWKTKFCVIYDAQIVFITKIMHVKDSMDADDERKSRLIFDEDYE